MRPTDLALGLGLLLTVLASGGAWLGALPLALEAALCGPPAARAMPGLSPRIAATAAPHAGHTGLFHESPAASE